MSWGISCWAGESFKRKAISEKVDFKELKVDNNMFTELS